MAKRKRFPYWMGVLLALAIGVASWSIYNILNEGLGVTLSFFGITNFYAINFIIVGAVLVLLIILGHPVKKAIDKLVK